MGTELKSESDSPKADNSKPDGSDAISFQPIGYFSCQENFKMEAPRQGVCSKSRGVIHLKEGMNYEQALDDLDGFKRIWLIYIFDRNKNWKPKVRPQNIDRKVGVFATRAPYRPNSIGMSCVLLSKTSGRHVFVEGHDLLDGTPILDIKPYLSYADAFTDKESLQDSCWWSLPQETYDLIYRASAQEKCLWLLENANLDLNPVLRAQLGLQPQDTLRKRIRQVESAGHLWELSFRTWRVLFQIDETQCQVCVADVKSAYSLSSEIPERSEYDGLENSIEIHKKFIAAFTT